MSLRARLLLGFLTVMLVLVAADALVAVTVRRSLFEQVDRRLLSAAAPLSRGARGASGDAEFAAARGTDTTTAPPSTPVPSDAGSGGSPSTRTSRIDAATADGSLTELFIERVRADGTVVRQIAPGLREGEAPPRIDVAAFVARATPAATPIRPFNVDAEGPGDLRYRVAVTEVPSSDQYLIVGVSLRETDATIGRLLAVEGGATAVVFLTLGLVAFWMLRLGVRPIDRMVATADAIAEGDLSRRIDVAPERTEVGRLGHALNGMLHQIEGAFAERQAGEDRLRRFVADASHELRTPLTSIRGYTELFRVGAIAEGPPLADAMARIESESTRMGALVDDLLLLARLDQDRPIESEPVDLSKVVDDAVADARAVEPGRRIELTLPPEPVEVMGDAPGLCQVVANLLANARTHTPPGSPVELRLTASGDRARLEVTDHGPGIEPSETRRIFERFYRSDASRVRSSGGSGLGLSIVAAVAQAHGGSAWVESRLGHGARFCVDLPLVAAATHI